MKAVPKGLEACMLEIGAIPPLTKTEQERRNVGKKKVEKKEKNIPLSYVIHYAGVSSTWHMSCNRNRD